MLGGDPSYPVRWVGAGTCAKVCPWCSERTCVGGSSELEPLPNTNKRAQIPRLFVLFT